MSGSSLRHLVAGLVVLTPTAAFPQTVELNEHATVRFDVAHLQPRRDSFRIVVGGTPLGSLVREYSRPSDAAGTLVVRSTLDLAGRVETSLTFRDPLELEWVEAHGLRDGRPIEVRLAYSAGHVIGNVDVPRPNGQRYTAAVDTTLDVGVMDDNVLQPLIPAMVFAGGRLYRFRTFDASAGVTRAYTLEMSDGGTVVVPAGTFETDRVRAVGGPAPLVFFISRELPRRTVRLELADGQIVLELVG